MNLDKRAETKKVIIVIGLLFFAICLWVTFPFIWQCKNLKDWDEIQKRITHFPDTLKEPISIPEKENGRYWYALAGLEERNAQIDRKYNPLINFIKNELPERKSLDNKSINAHITFKNKKIASLLKEYNEDLKLLKKGSSCKFFQQDYAANNTEFKYIQLYKNQNFAAVRALQQLTHMKALCEINNKEYDKAAETINDSFKFAISFSKNRLEESDGKNLIPTLVEATLTNISCKSLQYLLEKNDKNYPQLTKTLKQVKKEFSNENLKKVLNAELSSLLLISNSARTSESKVEFKKSGYSYILFTGTYEYDKSNIILQILHMISLIQTRAIMHNVYESFNLAIKYADTGDMKLLLPFQRYRPKAIKFLDFGILTPNLYKAIETYEKTQKEVNRLEKKLKKKGESKKTTTGKITK